MRCPLQCSLPLKQVSVNKLKSRPSDRDSVKTHCENNGQRRPLCEQMVYFMTGAQELQSLAFKVCLCLRFFDF